MPSSPFFVSGAGDSHVVGRAPPPVRHVEVGTHLKALGPTRQDVWMSCGVAAVKMVGLDGKNGAIPVEVKLP